MKAIQFNLTIPRYAAGLALGKLSPATLWSGLSCTTYEEIPDPTLPGEEWTIVQTQLGGVCGTDTSAISLKASPYFSPLTSSPFVFGHENAGAIADTSAAPRRRRCGCRSVHRSTSHTYCRPRT